ncbi:MAG: dynamin family protein [Myxococcota bacterium]
MSVDFRQGKSNVLAALREVADLADDSGSVSLADSLRDDRIPRLEEERFHLVVLGEFNHGKTTFVNALLGESVLPMGVTPTTAVIHHIEHGEKPQALSVSEEGKVREIEMGDLKSYVVEGGANKDDVRYVEVTYPAALLEEGVVLVDTPGVNDLNEQRAEITYGYIPRADAVIFLLDAGQILKESEREFISEKLLSASRDKLMFVINKVDLLDDDEKEQAVAYAKTHLATLVDNPRVYPLSAELALLGHGQSSGLESFVVDLRTFLQEERGRVLLDNALDQGLRVAAVLRTSVEVQKRALQMDQTELEKRLAALEADLSGHSETLEERKGQVRESLAAAKAMVRNDVESFGKAFAATLPEEIDGSKADDLKRFLPGFIEDKFREFADEQAQEVAKRLEGVAEEAIAFLTEDAAAQAERLREALGPSADNLDLKVNTFAYDVGVFALGAFGITVMAISNVFVGGALALAAPLLAYVFRGRADKRVKERAREEAPEVVRQAAVKLADSFEDQIDAFGEKLLAFMDKASEELSRSIADVVRTARTAKRSGEEAISDLDSKTGSTLARLSSVEDQMKAQRNALWSNGKGVTE